MNTHDGAPSPEGPRDTEGRSPGGNPAPGGAPLPSCEPIPIPEDAVRGLIVVLTAEQAAAFDVGRVGVVHDGQPRTAWLVGPVGAASLAGGFAEYGVRLVPLIHGGYLASRFTACGLGLVVTEAPLRAGEVVDLHDDVAGPFIADVVADSIGHGELFRTALHVRHAETAAVPTIRQKGRLARFEVLDVADSGVEHGPVALQGGQWVDVLDGDGHVHRGRVEGLEGRPPG